jgi:hypothetical protein
VASSFTFRPGELSTISIDWRRVLAGLDRDLGLDPGTVTINTATWTDGAEVEIAASPAPVVYDDTRTVAWVDARGDGAVDGADDVVIVEIETSHGHVLREYVAILLRSTE